jgi:hypothetical protein
VTPDRERPWTTTKRPTASLAEVVGNLQQLGDLDGLRLTVGIGRVVFEKVYGGEVELWRSRGKKHPSLRELARHPRQPFSRARLARAVGIYVLSLRRPDLLGLNGLKSCHLREILGLDDNAQDRLLGESVAQGWSVRRLRDEVRRTKTLRGNGGAGNVGAACVGLLRRWRAHIEAGALIQDLNRIDRIDPFEAAEALGIAKSLARQSETISVCLARRAGGRPASR